MENKELSLISNGTHIKGQLNVKDELHIYGSFEGEIIGHENSKVIIQAHGKVKGTLRVDELIIHGTLEGEATATHLLHVTQNGKAIGQIQSKELQVDHGAFVQASIKSR